jgi:hypothetical protein
MSPRLLRPLASGFNPKSIAGLSLWLDAADASTITVSTGVSVWADKSGNGRNAAQATGGKQPAYSSTINGKNVVTFQGTDDTMQIGANAAFNATSQTIIVVARQNADANQALWYKGDSNSAVGVIMRYRTGTTFWLYQKNDGLAETLAYNANTNSNVNIYSTVIEPANQSGFVNGTPVSTANVTTAYDNNSGPWLGSRRDVGEYLQGDIAEVLFWNRALTAAERDRVQKYLGKKWGITVASVPSVANPEAQDWISKTYVNGGTVSAGTAAAVSAFCDAIDEASIRDRFYRLNLFAGTGLNACLVPLYRGPSRTGTQYGNTTDTNTNFVSGDYVETGASGGLKGLRTSTKRLETGLAPAEFSGHNFHASSYECATSDTSYDTSLGAWRGANSAGFFMGTSDNTGLYDFSTINNAIRVTASPPDGHIVGTQTGNRTGAMFRNGVSASTSYVGGANTSSDWSLVTWGISVFAYQTAAGSFGDYSSARLGGYSVGLSMNGTQAAAFYTAMNAFQTSLTRNV